MNKKIITIILAAFLVGAFSFANEKLDADLAYLKRVLAEAYAGYEYNVEQGFDFDEAIENVRGRYLEKASDAGIGENDISDDLLAECINSEILQKLKVADNHFQIISKKSAYGFIQSIWYSSNVYFKKQGEDYYVAFSLNPKIRRKAKFTGKPENLFKVILFNKEYYVFGIQSDKKIKKTEISINNKTYLTKIRVGNFLKKHEAAHVGMKKTKKSIYFSFSDCTLNGYDRTSHTLISRKVQDYLLELKKNRYENIIVDLRGNFGGWVQNITPVLETANFEGDYKNLIEVNKKINTFRSSRIVDSDLTKEAVKRLNTENPAYYNFTVEDSTTEYYKKNPVTEYDFKPAFKGNIIIISDFNSASASELFIAFSYIFENVYLIGTNTSGTIDFGSLLDYYLPESGVRLHLASESYKDSDFLQKNPHWHGDTKGFYPDYWCTDNSLLPTLVAITKDKKLKRKLRGLKKHLL